MIKEIELTSAQENEFSLNRLGYYCRVRQKWNNARKKNDYLFDIVAYEDTTEIVIQNGTKLFSIGEIEAIKQRDRVIEYYLNKLKNN